MLIEIITAIGVVGYVKSEIQRTIAVKKLKEIKLQKKLSAELADKAERERRVSIINSFLSSKK